jgi:hypothetical protein
MKKRHLDLLPSMKCDTGCGDCCGIVPATRAEYEKVLHVAQAKGVTPKVQGLTCPFFQEGACQVYDARPFICRLFGHTPDLACSRGYNTNVAPDLEKKLTRRYGQPTLVLHQALVDAGLVTDLKGMFEAALHAVSKQDTAAHVEASPAPR